MPVRAPSLCVCGKVIPSGTICSCRKKAKAARDAKHDKKRGSASARGLDNDWRKLRARHLEKHQFCVRCGAKGKVVDHIVPRSIAPGRRLDPTNLQTLCTPCHSSAKQRAERRIYGD